MTVHRFVAVLAAVSAAALGAQPADVEVIVTASRIEEPAASAAASVSVITADDLVASGEPTLVHALEKLAGVSFRSTTGGPAQAEVSMRGFGENSSARVLVLVDGRRVNRPDMAPPDFLQVPVENVERVEVVRGPASVLYGDAAVGGVINIITKKGTDRVTVTGSAMGGSYLFNQERLGVSGPLGGARFALSGERTSSDGYRDRSAWSSLGGGASVDARMGRDIDASFRLGYNQTEYEMPGDLTKAQWEDDPTAAGNPADEASDRMYDADLRLRAPLGDSVEARLQTSLSQYVVTTDFVSLASYTDVAITTVTASPQGGFTREYPRADLAVNAGADIAVQQLEFERFSGPKRTNASRVAKADLDKNSAGLYATAGLTFNGMLTLEAGGRAEVAKIAASASLGSPLDDSKTHNGLAATASLLYREAEKMRASIRFDRTYRYPTLDEQVSYYNYGFDGFLADLEAEHGYGVDVGAAATPLAGLELSADGYLLDMDDEIAFNGATFVNENLDATRHLGATAQAKWTPGPLALTASYSGQLTTFRAGANEGNEVPLVPNHQVYAEAKLRGPFGVELAAGGRYVGESFQGGDTANAQDKVSDTFVLGASVTWRPSFVPGRLEVFAGVENLLDAGYAPVVYYNAFEPDPAKRSGYYPAAGRSWRVGGFYRY